LSGWRDPEAIVGAATLHMIIGSSGGDLMSRQLIVTQFAAMGTISVGPAVLAK
jgi:hypothetical protein